MAWSSREDESVLHVIPHVLTLRAAGKQLLGGSRVKKAGGLTQ